MAQKRSRQCKDCGTDNSIHKNAKENDIYDVEVMLCSACLQTRATLQTMKEDKLPFHKLIAKIRVETVKAMHSEDAYRQTAYYALCYGRYKGHSSYSTLSQYWVEQLTQQ